MVFKSDWVTTKETHLNWNTCSHLHINFLLLSNRQRNDNFLNNNNNNNKHEGDCDTYCNWCTWKTRRLRNKRTSRDPDYSITKIGQNTEKSPEDLRTLAVTQTQVKNHQLTLVGKLSKE